MKIFRLFLLFVLFHLTVDASLDVNRAEVLYDSCGGPSLALLKILDAFQIQHDESWNSIIHETQKNWIQKDQKERWNFPQTTDLNPERTFTLFSDLHLTHSFWAEECEYSYAIILGSTLRRVRVHLNFLKEEWEKGIRFKEIVFLTGDRPLDPIIENEKELLSSPYLIREGWSPTTPLPHNETTMMKFVYDQMALPEEWKTLPLTIVDTPTPQGKTRPNTWDTFVHWQAMNPLPGTILSISSQPFIGRQDTIGRQVLSSDFYLETVGQGFTFEEYKRETRGLTILLDEIARWIYQEKCVAN